MWTVPGVTEEMVSARLRTRMERQRRVLMRDDPPMAWFVIDELCLYRCVGSAEIMAAQMRHLATVARMPNVSLQVLRAVEHPANASELIVTESAAYVEHLKGGLVYTDNEVVSSMLMLFNSLQVESEKASASLETIERLGEAWTGGSPVFQAHRAGRASK
jgi:hypothetical protein